MCIQGPSCDYGDLVTRPAAAVTAWRQGQEYQNWHCGHFHEVFQHPGKRGKNQTMINDNDKNNFLWLINYKTGEANSRLDFSRQPTDEKKEVIRTKNIIKYIS